MQGTGVVSVPWTGKDVSEGRRVTEAVSSFSGAQVAVGGRFWRLQVS